MTKVLQHKQAMELLVKRLLVKAFFIDPSALGLCCSTQINYFQFSSQEIDMQSITGFDNLGVGERFYHHTDFNDRGRVYYRFLCTELGCEPKEEFDVDLDSLDSVITGSFHEFNDACRHILKVASEKMADCELDSELREFWSYIHSSFRKIFSKNQKA